MLDTQTKKKKRSQNNLLQTSLPLVWSAPVTQHMTAYCRCAMHKPSVLRVQMKGLRLRARPGGAARRGGRLGEELWEDGVGAGGKAAVAALPWYSANELHCCSTRTSFAPQETSLADRTGEREPRRHARAKPQHAAGTLRTRRAAICMF